MQVDESFQRWLEGRARAWVEVHEGSWDHAGWLRFLAELSQEREVDPTTAGRVLERCKAEYWHLRRWRDSGGAYRWVAERGGSWSHHDWMGLLAGLQCWLGPLDPGSVGQALEEARQQYRGLERWIDSGAPARWVEEHGGQWNHDDWLGLLAALTGAGYESLWPDAVGAVLEEHKAAYWNLERWEASGEPHRWVEAQRGRWDHADWVRLLASLERSEFWPLAPEAVGRVLEEARQRYLNLTRWQRSGAAWLWVSAQRGEWDHAAYLSLLAQFEEAPVDPLALGELLERLKAEYHALRHRIGLPGRRSEPSADEAASEGILSISRGGGLVTARKARRAA
jgi:hypothetical protein